MRKAIFRKFLQILFLALLLNTVIFYTVSSSVLLRKSRANMLFALETVDSLLDYGGDLRAQADHLRETTRDNNSRFTIIRQDGTVAADTGIQDTGLLDAGTMENHMEREEIKEAVRNGNGYATRHSQTLDLQMLYVARESDNGGYILRLAVPYAGMREYLELLFPAVLLSFAVAFLGSVLEAEHFSLTITRPLQEISRQMAKMDGDYTDFSFDPCRYGEINVIADTTTKMAQNVRDSMERLEKEKQIRQEFFGNASHELKTPLTSIRGYVELLESGMDEDEGMRRDFLSRIKKDAVRMTSLVDDILMISRLESRGARAELTDIRVRELIEESVASLASQAAERRVTVHRECCAGNGDGDFTVRADLRHMTELLTNLIGNAVKYNNPGGQVWVEAHKENHNLILTVRDDGVGIPRESQARIFERFYRVDKGRSRRQGGTGLGLSIVKHVVNFYHGTVKVESETGKGSIFTVCLPVIVTPDRW